MNAIFWDTKKLARRDIIGNMLWACMISAVGVTWSFIVGWLVYSRVYSWLVPDHKLFRGSWDSMMMLDLFIGFGATMLSWIFMLIVSGVVILPSFLFGLMPMSFWKSIAAGFCLGGIAATVFVLFKPVPNYWFCVGVVVSGFLYGMVYMGVLHWRTKKFLTVSCYREDFGLEKSS